MSKIVCDICGTTYAETETQCPICSSARPVDAEPVDAGQREYTYVKGGRFSKANVRKRNNGVAPAVIAPKTEKKPKKEKKPKPEKKPEVVNAPEQIPVLKPVAEEKTMAKKKEENNRGLIITAVVLLLAVIVVVGYIAVKFFWTPDDGGSANVSETISCTGITVKAENVTLEDGNESARISVSLRPINTTDKVSYVSLNPEIATVDENGNITAIAPGEAKIKITCGIAEAYVTVTSTVGEPKITLTLTRKSLKLQEEFASYILYTEELCGIHPDDIVWSTDDDAVATIDGGVVVAIGEGTTKVHGEYDGQKVTCEITVEYTDNPDLGGNGIGEDGGNTGIGEDGGNTGAGEDTGNVTPVGEIKIYTPWNTEVTDFTLNEGEKLTLTVKDSAGNVVNATFTVDDNTVCSFDGNVVTGLGGGKGTITATCNGLVVTCTIYSW